MKPGYKTTEFWLTLAASFVGALLTSGLIADGSNIARALGVAAIVLSTLGYSVSRGMAKSGSPATTAAVVVEKTPQGGFSQLEMLFAIAIMGAVVGCAWLHDESKRTAGDVVDCTTSEAKSLAKQFGPMVDSVLVTSTQADKTIDTDRLKDAAKGFATDTARCVLADAIARALNPKADDPNAPKSSPLEADPVALRQAFAELADGKTYHTEHGTL